MVFVIFFTSIYAFLETAITGYFEFKENKFKEWSEKARELRNSYNDSKIEEFRLELQKLSQVYCKK